MDLKYIKLLTHPNKFIASFILNLIFSTIFINISSTSNVQKIIQFGINYLLLFLLHLLVDTIIKKYLKPSGFVNKDKISIQDTIEINTTSWGRGIPVLNEEDYQEKFNYQMSITRLIVVSVGYFFLLIILSWIKVYFILNNIPEIFVINYYKMGEAALLIIMYFVLSICGGIWIYDKENSIHNKDSFIYPIVTIGLTLTMFILILTSYI